MSLISNFLLSSFLILFNLILKKIFFFYLFIIITLFSLSVLLCSHAVISWFNSRWRHMIILFSCWSWFFIWGQNHYIMCVHVSSSVIYAGNISGLSSGSLSELKSSRSDRKLWKHFQVSLAVPNWFSNSSSSSKKTPTNLKNHLRKAKGGLNCEKPAEQWPHRIFYMHKIQDSKRLLSCTQWGKQHKHNKK